jgi:hypothetical protein
MRRRFCWTNSIVSTGFADVKSLKKSDVPGGTENFTHHPDQLQDSRVANPVVDAVGLLAAEQDTLVAQDRQVLGYIALRCSDRFDDLLHAGFLAADYAEYLEAQRVRNRLQGARCGLDMLLLIDQTDARFQAKLLCYWGVVMPGSTTRHVSYSSRHYKIDTFRAAA